MSNQSNFPKLVNAADMFANCAAFNTPISGWDSPRQLYTFLSSDEVKEFKLVYPLPSTAQIVQDKNTAIWVITDSEKPSRAFINYFRFLIQTRNVSINEYGEATAREFEIAQEEIIG